MEARIARLESDVEYLRTDVAEMKADLRRLRDKVDELKESIRAPSATPPALHRRDPFALPLLLIYLLVLGILLAALSHGFGWI
jgi:hypothetical protein